MNCFIAISPDTARIQTAVKTHFAEFNHELAPGVWVVAGADTAVTSEICKTLGMDKQNAGVAFALSSYHGFYDATLWEKLSLWEGQ